MNSRLKHILKELSQHLPYTILSVALGMMILGILTYFAIILNAENFPQASKSLFHIFHPLHMLFSACATTAMFWRHERKFFKAILIGFIGAVGVCGIGDIFLPFIAGNLLGIKMELHICIIKHPGLILPFTLFGIFAGLIVPQLAQSTLFSHAGHVFVSSMASILYLVSFGLTDWIIHAGMVFIYIVLAVMIPCCTSDIIFPLMLTKRR